MKIAIIRAGNVGGTLAKSSVRAGHTVILTSKDPSHAEAKGDGPGAIRFRMFECVNEFVAES
jgi:Trk K+ transport system NAD-binding subunit